MSLPGQKDTFKNTGFYRFSRRNFLGSLLTVLGGTALFFKSSLFLRGTGKALHSSEQLPRIPEKELPDKIPGPDERLPG
ncbi:MAG: hypothetical protein ACE5GM_02100 [bacterium]